MSVLLKYNISAAPMRRYVQLNLVCGTVYCVFLYLPNAIQFSVYSHISFSTTRSIVYTVQALIS